MAAVGGHTWDVRVVYARGDHLAGLLSESWAWQHQEEICDFSNFKNFNLFIVKGYINKIQFTIEAKTFSFEQTLNDLTNKK